MSNPNPNPGPRGGLYSAHPAVFYVFGLKPRFVYAPIPKAGCTTILTLIYKKLRAQNPRIPIMHERDFSLPGFHQFMTFNFTLSRLKVAEAESLLADPEVFKFTFVRNPLARVASGFLNKFVRDRYDMAQWVHTRPVLQHLRGKNALPWVQTISFADFVGYICETPDEKLDKHWRPMHGFLSPEVDFFVGRLERMEEDYAEVARRIGLDLGLTQKNRTERKGSDFLPDGELSSMNANELRELPSLPRTEQLYTPALERAVRDRFKIDFETFGY